MHFNFMTGFLCSVFTFGPDNTHTHTHTRARARTHTRTPDGTGLFLYYSFFGSSYHPILASSSNIVVHTETFRPSPRLSERTADQNLQYYSPVRLVRSKDRRVGRTDKFNKYSVHHRERNRFVSELSDTHVRPNRITVS
jgi:hypothetical protein